MTQLSFSADVSSSGVVEHSSHTRDAYDAATTSSRRKSPPATVQREDRVLPLAQRTRMQANAQDIVRNYSIAAWMCRQHLNYVAPHEFHPATKDKGFNDELKQWMQSISRPEYFDAGRRCGREKFFRLCEARRVIDGDTFALLIKDGTIEGIESDKVRNPPKTETKGASEWIQGIRTAGGGAAMQYSFYNRGRGGAGYEFARVEPYTRVLHYGFFERFASDQTRGISPVAAALDPLRDVYEAKGYALAKAKVSQLIALAFFRDAVDSLGDDDVTAAEDCDDASNGGPRYTVDFGQGPIVLDLDDGDQAKFLESATPSTEFQAFMSMVTALAMKALDLPYSFYDESHATWHGSRSAWLHYERSCDDKRGDQQELRRRWTLWRMSLGIRDGDFALPSDWTLRDVRFRWVPRGTPWWKPSEEVRGDLESVAAGFNNPQEVCLQRGTTTYEENIEALAEALKLAEEIGNRVLGRPIVPRFDPGPAPAVINASNS